VLFKRTSELLKEINANIKTPSFNITHFNPLNAELNPICHLLALLVSHHILHVSRIRVKLCRLLAQLKVTGSSEGSKGQLRAIACHFPEQTEEHQGKSQNSLYSLHIFMLCLTVLSVAVNIQHDTSSYGTLCG